jgi:putative alpha-1,2-mannosidase
MNKKSLLFVPVLSLCLASCGSSQKGQEMEDLTQFVDPRIGTGGHGHVFYGANVPYGFIQLGLQIVSNLPSLALSGYYHKKPDTRTKPEQTIMISYSWF